MLSFFLDVGSKLWNIGKRLVPLYGIFEFLRWIFADYFRSLANRIIGSTKQKLAELSVDIAVPAEYYAEINAVVPLYEAMQYLGLYLGLVLVVTGYKWLRNVIPGLS